MDKNEKLKRLEQENEQLKKSIDRIMQDKEIKTIDSEIALLNAELQQENKRLKEENERIKRDFLKQNQWLQDQKKEIDELKTENERLKEELRTEKIYSSQIEELEESLQHAKVENEKLKQVTNESIIEQEKLIAKVNELQAENERLKEENYQLQKDCQICENFIDFIPCKPIRDMDYDLQKVISQRDNYYQTLQEIREIAKEQLQDVSDRCINTTPMYIVHKHIIDKINEVIGAE